MVLKSVTSHDAMIKCYDGAHPWCIGYLEILALIQ